ncbi:P27 family phage terminase small subunit [Reyranella soli]|uniref:Terminase n=1 Tax=Reyranella soli TaxID=1230389 RepID=A0A512NT04_9HYPH|nr:P27 family phage terminase small subunit [Reyranella soli]GEP62096.1 hypothetical protein RSO01_92620 [Reyranella soli]
MDDEQKAQWHYAIEHSPLGLLTKTDREILAVWVTAAGEHARASQEVRKLGQVVKTRDGNSVQNPYLPIVNRQATIMLRAGAEMGFSPASRAAIGAAAPMGLGAPSRLRAYLDEKPDRLD